MAIKARWIFLACYAAVLSSGQEATVETTTESTVVDVDANSDGTATNSSEQQTCAQNNKSEEEGEAEGSTAECKNANVDELATPSASSLMVEEEESYLLDISWPMHELSVSTNYPWLPHNVDPEHHPTPKEYENMPLQPLGNRQAVYDEFLQGCKDYYRPHGTEHRCQQTENERVHMTRSQPHRMTNYTSLGFKKIKAPKEVYALIKQFWDQNKDMESDEGFPTGYTYINNWVRPSTMVSVENTTLPGGGPELKQRIWNAARATISEWTGQRLRTSSLYGIRVYKEGAILAPHVDRLPLVSSCIINVDQDVDEDWPLEVFGHDGKIYNVSMAPGDMVLYESHSIIHGRPFTLKGRFYANIFIHFEPDDNVNAHVAAQEGDADMLRTIARWNEEELHAKDRNGWTPLHEAARSGSVESIQVLLDHGVDVNDRTNSEDTALFWAVHEHGDEHESAVLLRNSGGIM